MTEVLSNLNDYKKFRVISKTIGNMDEDGYWKVTSTIIQEVSEDGEKWDHREASISVIDRDANKASMQAYMSLSAYMQKIEGDLFRAENDQSGLLQ